MMFRTLPFLTRVFQFSLVLLVASWSMGVPVVAQQVPEPPAGAEPGDEPDTAPAEQPDVPAEEPDGAAEAEAPKPATEPEAPAGTGQVSRRPDIGKQPYLVVPVDEEQKRARTKIMGILRNRKFEAGEEDVFDAYYRRYFLPRWTQPANRASLPSLRKDLRNNLMSARTGPPHSRLNAIVLDYLGKMAAANVHPAARVNAMLMIGELNEVEPIRAGDNPTPLPAALPVLLANLEDDGQIDPAKVAALVGIIRHAQFGRLSPEASSAIQRTMVQLAGSPGAPARSVEGHAWMRAQAAKALGLLRLTGENGVVPRILATLVAEDQLDMLVRCHAAGALGQLNYTGSAGLNASQAIAALRQLAADAIRADTAAFEANPDSFSRRRIKTRFVAVRRGLFGDDEDEQSRGIAPLATGAEDKKTLAALRDELDKLLALFDDKQVDDAQLVEEFQASLARWEPANRAATAQAER